MKDWTSWHVAAMMGDTRSFGVNDDASLQARPDHCLDGGAEPLEPVQRVDEDVRSARQMTVALTRALVLFRP